MVDSSADASKAVQEVQADSGSTASKPNEQEEIMKQIAQNEEYANQLKKDIEESSPFVSDLLPLEVLKEEYRENKFENCFDDLSTKYKQVRRMRRDGNCFYRAYLY